MWRRLVLLLGLLALATAASPATPLHAQGWDPNQTRIGRIGFDFGGRAAWGRREYNGYDTRTASMGSMALGAQFSFLHLLRPREKRLRITDYIRADADIGWKSEKQHDLPPNEPRFYEGGSIMGLFTYSFGIHATYLVNEALEVGAIVAKGTWKDEIPFDVGNVFRDTGTPTIWTGQIRLHNLIAEVHYGATPISDWHIQHFVDSEDRFSHRDIYRSFQIRRMRPRSAFHVGFGFERYDFRVYRDEPSDLRERMTNRSATSITVFMGAQF